jgi:hypothetical protein
MKTTQEKVTVQSQVDDNYTDEIQGSYGSKKITVGNRVESEGDIHLGNPNDSFIGEFIGYTLPEGFKTPVLLFRINGEIHRMNSCVDLMDKLVGFIPEGSTNLKEPIPVKIVYTGDEEIGRGKMHNFKVFRKK